MKSHTSKRRPSQRTPKHPHADHHPDVDADADIECAVVVHPIKKQIARERESPAVPGRGNGYSSNPHGPLEATDYGVHSHPCTTELLKKKSDKT